MATPSKSAVTGTALIAAAKGTDPERFARLVARYGKRFSPRVAEISAAGDICPALAALTTFDSLHA